MYGIPWRSSNISFIFAGVAMLYQFPPKVLKPSEELGLPVAPRREAANSLRITEVFFLGWGGATQICDSFSLSLRIFFVFGSQNSWCWSPNGWLLDVVGVRIDVPCTRLGDLSPEKS